MQLLDTAMEVIQQWSQKLDACDMATVSIVLVLFVVLSFFCQRRTWIWMEIIVAVLCGISFVAFPAYVLRIQTSSEPNDKMVFAARLYGAMLLASGVTFYRSKDTRDATVTITLMMSRVCLGSTLVMSQLVSYFAGVKTKSTNGGEKETSVWSDKFILMFVLPTVLWTLGNMVHLLRSHDFSTYPQHNVRLNNCLHIDAWMMLFAGVMMLAFPRQIISLLFSTTSVPKEVTLHVIRSCGAVCLSEAVISLQAPGFLHHRDKFLVFGTRIVWVSLMAGLLCAGCFLHGLVNITRLYCFIPLLLPVLANALAGLFTDTTTIYVVPTPTKAPRNAEMAGDGKKYY